MNRTTALIAIPAAGLAIGLGGCVEQEGSAQPSKVTKTVTVPAPPPPDPGSEAETTVRAFYGALNSYDYAGAWRYLSSAARAEMEGFSTWRQGYDYNLKSRLQGFALVSESASEVVFTGSLAAHDLDACGTDVYQRFSGSWTLEPSSVGDWIISDIDLAKVSGETPVLDPAGCTPAAPPANEYGPAPSPDDSYEYDRPYPDLDCEDVGSNIPVGPDDPNGFDADGDGIGCES